MVAFPFCKINLGLRVLRRREDGFHDIETCFYPVPRTDILEIVPSTRFKFEQTGISLPGSQEDNLCVKAYQLLRDDYDLAPVEIYLHKMIPAGSGLGGGSSDGTWTLRLLNSVFDLSLSQETLESYANRLGSDCAYFLHDKPMLGTGRGEKLSPVNLALKGNFLVIVRPDVHVSTQAAYQSVTPSADGAAIPSILSKLSPRQWKGRLINQFEADTIKRHPTIGVALERLYSCGATYASMSGSGSAVYGLFDSAVNLSDKFRGMDYWSGWLDV